jgi:hypothetical protein
MLRLLILLLTITVIQGDCWKLFVINPEQKYVIKNEGKLQNVEDVLSTTEADLVIDADTSSVIRSGNSTPLGDTVVISY